MSRLLHLKFNSPDLEQRTKSKEQGTKTNSTSIQQSAIPNYLPFKGTAFEINNPLSLFFNPCSLLHSGEEQRARSQDEQDFQ